MNILDDKPTPKKTSDGSTLIVLGLLTLIAVFIVVMSGGFTFAAHIHASYTFSRGFNTAYYLGLLFLPVAIGIYLIMLGKRFEKLHKDHDSKHFPKILSLNTQLLFLIMIWVIMVAGFMMEYVYMPNY